jgi:hypothetical protein
MHAFRPAALALSLLLLGGTVARGDEAPAPVRGVRIGEVVPAFDAVDPDGRPFSLATARTIREVDALAAATDAAKRAGASDPKTETPRDGIPGVLAEGRVDAGKRVALVQEAFRPFGLVASEATTKDLVVLGDVAKRIVASANAPIVLFAWSSKCPTIELYEERFAAWFARTGARVFAFAPTEADTAETVRAALARRRPPYRILLDPDARIADLLGARTTPQSFVVDEKGLLRYDGAPDSDPAETKDEAKRIPYLLDAIVAVADGRSVDIRMTNPTGCRIRRRKA